MPEKNRLNILILTNYFPPEIGAASHLYYELARELVKRGHQVRVITRFPRNFDQSAMIEQTGKGMFVNEDIKGIKVTRIKVPHLWRRIPLSRELEHFINLLALFFGTLFTKRSDVILVYSPPIIVGLVAVLIGRLKRIPTVINIQDLFPKYVIQIGVLKNKFLISVCEYLEKFLYRWANVLTVYSTGNKDHIASKSIDHDKVSIIPNWIDTDFVRPLEPSIELINEYGINAKFVVLFAGSMSHPQDMDIILESARTLADRSEILFLIVGEGPKAASTRQKAKELKLKNVKFLPLQPRSKYPQLLASVQVALVTINPSMTTPVVPSKTLSIMASGTPLIASLPLDGGDAPRIVRESKAGILVKAGDVKAFTQAVLRLYNEPELCQELGRNGRKYAEEVFSLRKCTQNYEKLFSSLKS